jgi:PIN domain nuclease of toxin-antitoxin system
MRYLLDTNAWVWLYSDPGKIRKSVRDALNQESRIGLSPLSIVEVAQKAA